MRPAPDPEAGCPSAFDDGSLRGVTRSSISLRLLLASVLFAGCAHAPASVVATAPSGASPAERYARAVADAREPTPAEIDGALWPLAPANASLAWDVRGETRRVRVVTWTAWDGYDPHVGQAMPMTREVWVTPVPQVQSMCRSLGLSGDGLVARLGGYLGLPPGTVKTRMVELWVDPADVFRPCPDAEVDDDRCDLAFPERASAEHRAWIEALRARSYGADGYPWTQLGYTYDWARDDDHVGASEFVVRAGATALVASVQSTDAYCAPAAP